MSLLLRCLLEASKCQVHSAAFPHCVGSKLFSLIDMMTLKCNNLSRSSDLGGRYLLIVKYTNTTQSE